MTFAEEVRARQQGLNPAIWSGRTLKVEVREKLLAIADSFLEDLKTHALDPLDILITGSNANFNWNAASDIDLHIMADLSKVDCDFELASDYFHEHSFLWNEHHGIKLHGFPVEIYVQDVNEPHHASGVYSVKNRKWVKTPQHVEAPPEAQVTQKAQPLIKKIDGLIGSGVSLTPEQLYKKIDALRTKIRDMRKSSLARDGETAIENLVFKHLRRTGHIGRLQLAGRAAYDRSMSLGENQIASQISMCIQEIGTWE
jgi:hypothetical protein